MTIERLDKIVASVCGISRKDAKSIIRSKRVSIDGNIVLDADCKVGSDSTITVDGVEMVYNKYVYIMLNKPSGILSASNDKSRETVVDLVKPFYNRKGLFPVGRLDKDTTGFLIITDNGDFGHAVISPKNMIEKEYVVDIDKPISDCDIHKLEGGVVLADGVECRPAKIKVINTERDKISMVLTEGKYHEIKRMLGVVGIGVNKLKRIRIGDVLLDMKLNEGEFRELTNAELDNMLKMLKKIQ